MKIVVFYQSMNQHGGAPKVYSKMTSYWVDICGYDITIFTHYGSDKSVYPISDKVKIVSVLPNVNPVGKIARSLNSPKLFPSFYRRIKKEKPDLVIINDGPYYALVLGAVVCKILKLPFIVWCHSGYYMKSSPMYKIARRVFFPMAKAVTVLTNGDKKHIEKLNPNTFVIKNPVEEIKDKPLSDNNVALFVGRLVEQKSVHHLLEAWKKASLQGWELHIVGGGSLKDELQKFVIKLGISDSVIFFGERDDVELFYDKASFFVMSSMHEGLPMVLLEALSHGLPLISYNAPYGPADIIDDGQNGFIVQNGDIDGLAEAIQKMAACGELRKNFAKHSFTKTAEFSIDKIAEKWYNILVGFSP